jgi:hypothetical protein
MPDKIDWLSKIFFRRILFMYDFRSENLIGLKDFMIGESKFLFFNKNDNRQSYGLIEYRWFNEKYYRSFN